MKIYDFDTYIERHNTASYKWDSCDNKEVLPLWVADMDFRTSDAIIEALHKRVEHGIFGYTKVPDAYYKALNSWFERKHDFSINSEWVIYTSGVVPAISATLKALCEPGDKVIIQTPVYNCFFSSIRNNDCTLLDNKLIRIGNTYKIDFEDFEKKASDPRAKVFLLCNPHNPACRVWTREELMRMGEICKRNNVVVVSDEIHCEFTFGKHKFIPFASLSEEMLENSVSFSSPSKAFNIAGLQIANIVCANSSRRELINKAININEVCDVNCFGVEALIAAYNEGEEWLEQLKEYLYDNYKFLLNFFTEKRPQYSVTELEGTYLVWLDCRKLTSNTEKLCQTMRDEQNVWFNPGEHYGTEGFIRINIACSRKVLSEALNRLYKALKQ